MAAPNRSPAQPWDVVTYRLREGVTISGRLLVNGNPPPAGTFVKANYRSSGLWGRNVVLHDDGTEVGDVRARVGPVLGSTVWSGP